MNIFLETSGRDVSMCRQVWPRAAVACDTTAAAVRPTLHTRVFLCRYISHFFPDDDGAHRKLLVHFSVNDIRFVWRRQSAAGCAPK
jgi:hypothetical protein